MKSIFRATLINASALFMLTQILPGVKVSGGLTTFVLGGFVLCILFKVLKPILSIISLPLNILTLGLASFLINVVLFYIATALIPGISISAFTLQGFSFSGFVIPTVNLNTLLAYAAAGLGQSVIVSFISWLRK